MKKLIYVVIIAIVMVFALTFIYSNQEVVTVDYYGEYPWGFSKTLPLSLLLIGTFIGGLIIGYLFSVLTTLRLRGQLMSSKRKLKKVEST